MERDRVCEGCQMWRPATAFEPYRNTRRRVCKSCRTPLLWPEWEPYTGQAAAAVAIIPEAVDPQGREVLPVIYR